MAVQGTVVSTDTISSQNALINGDMVIWQRGTSIVSDSTPVVYDDDTIQEVKKLGYTRDGDDIVDVTRSTTGYEGGSDFSCQLEVETVDKKFGIVQIIEAVNCHDLIGGKVSLSFHAMVAGS